LLHAVATVLLFLVLLEFAKKILPAFGGALLWAVHPVQTQAVTYASQQITLLAGIFSSAAALFYLRGKRMGRPLEFALSGIAYLLALGCRETAGALPALAMVYELAFGEKDGREKRLWILAFALLPPIGMAFGYWRMGIEGMGHGPAAVTGITPWTKFLSAGRVYAAILSLLVFPAGLSIDWGMKPSEGLFDPWTTLPALAFLGAILFAAFQLRKYSPLFFFCAFGFFGVLAPETLFLPLDLVFEHRLYGPSALLIPLAAFGLFRLVEKETLSRSGAIGAGLVLVLASSGATALRNRDWRSAEALYRDNLKHWPENARVHLNLGAILFAEGNPVEAIDHFRWAIDLYPDSPEAHENLGLALVHGGKPEEGLGHLREAIRLAPERSESHYNMGLVIASQNKCGEALAYFKEAVRLAPKDARPLVSLGACQETLGEKDAAELSYQRALALDPDSTQALVNLGAFLTRRARFRQAIPLLERAVAANPNEAVGFFYLGRAKAGWGQPGAALLAFRTACQLGHTESCEEAEVLERE
ncbi:MAG: tetratricopeptide repeat protein, partial [Bdellovibrionota bacterium]